MLIYLLRHGETEYNTDKRYQGTRDIPLSPAGRAELCRAEFAPQTVYVSPLGRAVETARILFPEAALIPVENFKEMCFGIFEGRNFIQMEHDPEYRAWVGEDCMGRCPGGESRGEFSARTCKAFAALVEQALARHTECLVIVAHGGTQMAVMERYGCPHRDYYQWCAGNGAGYVLDTAHWPRQLDLLREVHYTKG